MSCYHPYRALKLRYPDGSYQLTENGKNKIKILHKVDKYFSNNNIINSDDDFLFLPCGQCIGCRLDYSRQWANRLMLELEYHDSAYFVTFTYNELNVPKHQYKADTGEVLTSYSLEKRDIQLFFKRLRKAFPDDHIRFFLSGEYGPSTFRPHYHAIIFGLHLNDKYVWRTKKVDNMFVQYYRSPSLERAWSVWNDSVRTYVPLGNVEFSDVTWNTCAYVARYVTKKLTGNASEFYFRFNLVPPFSLMSRKPGIAAQWYEDHKDGLYDYDKITINTPQGGKSFMPPKYFDHFYEIDAPDEYKEYKAVRAALCREALLLKIGNSQLSYGQMLEVEESIKNNQIKSLDRSEV